MPPCRGRCFRHAAIAATLRHAAVFAADAAAMMLSVTPQYYVVVRRIHTITE